MMCSPGVIDRVGQQVLENQPEHGGVALNLGQRADAPVNLPTGGFVVQFVTGLRHQRRETNPARVHLGAAHAREQEQVINQFPHLPR